MKTIILVFGVLVSFLSSAQTKGKIIPIDKSILKLIEDTTERVIYTKLPSGYVVSINKTTNKKDTSISYVSINKIFNKRGRKNRF